MSEWFSNPAGLWAALLAVPLLLLYMLRHRPVRRRVPSIVLWTGVAQAQISTSPFQRLRNSLSLFLMLAALLSLVLALAGLRIPHGSAQGLPLTVVLDVTASMGAKEGARTRLQSARELAARAIDQAGNSRVSVLAWDGALRPVAPADSTPSVAVGGLSTLRVSPRGADSAGLARALKQLRSDARTVVLVGDRDPGVEQGVGFLQAATSQPNAAIVTAGVTEHVTGKLELSFGIELFGAEAPRRVTLALERANGDTVELVDARDLRLEPGRRIASTFTVSQPGLYQGVLRVSDALEMDDNAWVRATSLPVLTVSAGPGTPESVVRALAAIEQGMGIIRVVESPEATAHVFAGVESAGARTRMPAAYIGPLATPPGSVFVDQGDVSGTPARPLPGFLWRGAGTPDILARRAWVVEYTGPSRPVLEVDGGAAIALCERENGLRDLAIGLQLEGDGSSTFADLPAFVIFWANWFDYVRELVDPLPRGALTTRDTLRVPALDGRRRFAITPPQGDATLIDPGAGYALPAPGVYRVRDLETDVPLLGVSMLDAQESDLTVGEAADNEAALATIAQGAEAGERGALDLAPWLALLGAALLVTEWALFRRRFPRGVEQKPSAHPHTHPVRA